MSKESKLFIIFLIVLFLVVSMATYIVEKNNQEKKQADLNKVSLSNEQVNAQLEARVKAVEERKEITQVITTTTISNSELQKLKNDLKSQILSELPPTGNAKYTCTQIKTEEGLSFNCWEK